MNIDFSQMHCARSNPLQLMESYIDVADKKGCAEIVIGKVWLYAVEPQQSPHSTDYILADEDGRSQGIDTPEELQEVLTRWGHL